LAQAFGNDVTRNALAGFLAGLVVGSAARHGAIFIRVAGEALRREIVAGPGVALQGHKDMGPGTADQFHVEKVVSLLKSLVLGRADQISPTRGRRRFEGKKPRFRSLGPQGNGDACLAERVLHPPCLVLCGAPTPLFAEGHRAERCLRNTPSTVA
jgi:hypothetical protein